MIIPVIEDIEEMSELVSIYLQKSGMETEEWKKAVRGTAASVFWRKMQPIWDLKIKSTRGSGTKIIISEI
ncbi:MAG: hypothetical protein JEZ04_05780 [Spirochaetales bacterium]|nr:hypothetical protein [Spirochaetales bacterium]